MNKIVDSLKSRHITVAILVLLSLPAAHVYAAEIEFENLMKAISSSGPISDPKVVQEILKDAEIKGKINFQNKKSDFSPLCLAAAKGNPKIVEELLNHGADLGQTVEYEGKKATPFILAAQYNHPDVMELILKSPHFTLDNFKQEIQNAKIFKQVALAKQLVRVLPASQSEKGSSASCSQKKPLDEFASDITARAYHLMDVSCAVCLGLPGEVDKAKLIDGTSHTGDSASTNCCGQIFCKTCLETAAAANKNKRCPSCRHEQMTFEVTHNALAPVHWVGLPGGSNRAPIPGQPMEAQAAVGTLGQGNVIENFKSQFVSIPAGKLPGGIQVASFEANKFPVTRDLWQEIMGGIPGHVPDDKKAAWHQCPRCPVTDVNWENADGSSAEVQDFVTKLNRRQDLSGCTYKLPNDKQLWYVMRGDPTGENQDQYSKGITAHNVNEYVTHSGNSNGQVQPVGERRLNAFGVELGNVWKMSSDLYDTSRRNLGRSMRGGSWRLVVSNAESGNRNNANAGNRNSNMGFDCISVH